MKTKSNFLILIALITMMVNCRKPVPVITDPATYVYLGTGRGVVGTLGGEVYIGDSLSPVHDAVCAFKAGTLNGPVQITLTMAPANIAIANHINARIIHVQPDTLSLNQNVTIGMSYSHLNPNYPDWVQLYRYDPANGQLTPLASQVYDTNRKIIYGSSAQLGYFAVFQENIPDVSTGSFADPRDSQIYQWVKINNQVWMAENLNFVTGTGSYCYNDNPANCTTYGRLYNWTTAASVCPAGWHLPTQDEWITLETALGFSGLDLTSDQWKTDGLIGKKLKSTSGWLNNGNGSDIIHFTALPGGFRDGDGTFAYLGTSARFWTRTPTRNGYWARYINEDHDGIYWAVRGGSRSFSVRCVQGVDQSKPVVKTASVSNVTGHSASCGGEVLSSGGSPVTARGVCWNTTGFPMAEENHTTDGSGNGIFSSELTGLTPNTTYYVRAYATNGTETGYGKEVSFTTLLESFETGSLEDPRDIHTYTTVKYGDTWWMAENLNFNTNAGSWCYNEDLANCTTYGRLYDWETAGAVCPPGWYLPTDADWQAMETVLGMSTSGAENINWRLEGSVGKRIKSTTGWDANGNGLNDSKFNALPGGFRDGNGAFSYLGQEARFWTSGVDAGQTGDPWIRFIKYDNDGVYRSTRGASRGMSVRCVKGTNPALPQVSTGTVSQITDKTAVTGGNVTASGSTTITQRGVCWNTTGYPLVNESHTVDGSGTGSFTSTLSNLQPLTTYYLRAYATNQNGTAYGAVVLFTTQNVVIIPTGTMTDTRDGKIYKTVRLGSVWWMAENLNYQTPAESWCYNQSVINCNTYGRLYTHTSAQIACPSGWHLPSDEEWKQLEMALGMSRNSADATGWRAEGRVGYKMKSTSGWIGNGNGSNESKFNVLPAGFRDGNGSFLYLSEKARFWTLTPGPAGDPYIRYFQNDQDGIYRETRGIDRGFSIRCVKN
ncbi:MAG: hypothetical protein J7L89_09045 [Bacteroidales bacterium]|nr:hypothetical protein [Bacteroidales bacterium]